MLKLVPQLTILPKVQNHTSQLYHWSFLIDFMVEQSWFVKSGSESSIFSSLVPLGLPCFVSTGLRTCDSMLSILNYAKNPFFNGLLSDLWIHPKMKKSDWLFRRLR